MTYEVEQLLLLVDTTKEQDESHFFKEQVTFEAAHQLVESVTPVHQHNPRLCAACRIPYFRMRSCCLILVLPILFYGTSHQICNYLMRMESTV